MKDFSEIKVLDKSFELNETIAQNERLTKTNNWFFYGGLISILLLAGTILFIANNKPPIYPSKKKS